MALLLQLLLAHLIGDFFLQLNSWIKNKERLRWISPYLFLHSLLHGLLVIILTGGLQYLPQAIFIAVTHYLIDGSKLQFQKEGTKRAWFFIDQALHLVILSMVWLYTEHIWFSWHFLKDPKVLILITAFVTLLTPASYAIQFFISKWAPWPLRNKAAAATVPTINDKEDESLEKAGRIIGMIERTMILCFILLNKWEAIGFLLAAKSIFRFGELTTAKDRRLTEYVLIGTLVSFFVAIITGIITVRLLN